MTDREKVVRGLECCLKDDCDNCPYYDPEVDHDCDYFGKCLRGNMYHDALALLKAQEPVEPTKDENSTFWYWRCGECGVPITEGDKFCRMCGRAVKWE